MGDVPRQWSNGHSLIGVPNNKRCRDLIDLVYAQHHISSGKKPNEQGFVSCELVLDVSQAINRSCYAEAFARSMCSGSSYYYYAADRMLTSWEHLSCTTEASS